MQGYKLVPKYMHGQTLVFYLETGRSSGGGGKPASTREEPLHEGEEDELIFIFVVPAVSGMV
jgi:hypothetical protein